MRILANGRVQFDTFGEMYYNLFMEIGLGINSQQYLYDQDSGIVLKFKDHYIKATTNDMPIYAGKTDIVFEPDKNYGLITTLIGYYIDKESMGEDGDTVGFVAQEIEDNNETETHRVIIVTKFRGTIVSEWYHNTYLGYIDAIFRLGGNSNIDLLNFDVVEE